MITDDDITRHLAPLLLRPLRPAERLKIAAALESLAAQQRELANADQHIGHVVRRVQMDAAPRSAKGGRPKGTGARFVRVQAPISTERSWRLHIGRALYQELGEPARLDVQRIGSHWELRPCDGNSGYAVTAPPNGMPRLSVGVAAIEALRLEEGRYPAQIRAGAIVVA